MICQNILKAAITCCLFFIQYLSVAQDYIDFSGTVKDVETGETLPFLKVLVSNRPIILTDESGFFSVKNLLTTDTIAISGMGYFEKIPATVIKTYKDVIPVRQRSFEMAGVKVSGFRSSNRNVSSAASYGIVSKQVLVGNDQSSLQNAVNLIPGVTMESRGYGGSQRISIRGSFLRSPFAVRNVKMYLEGIPLSSPDGSSPLELMDSYDLGGIEIIKGQGGSLYGSGTGGVMIFKHPFNMGDSATSFHRDFTTGAFGWLRSATSVESRIGSSKVRISHIYQHTDGYRDQEFNRKQQFSIMVKEDAQKLNTKFFLYATYFKGHLGLPGSLNDLQAEVEPIQANLFSMQNNASLYRERAMIGMSGETWISENWKLLSSVYFYATQKYNPYGTSLPNSGFKDERAMGHGGRAHASRNLMNGSLLNWNAGLGAEYQSENFKITESGNAGGLPGDFKYQYDVNYESVFPFVQTDIRLLNRVVIESGISVNRLLHKVDGDNSAGFVYDTSLTLKTEFLPRVSASFRFADELWLHASIARGISNPTVFEQVDAVENTFNTNLLAESGINKEINLKGVLPFFRFQFEISAYQFELDNAIIAYNDSILNTETNLYEEIGRYKNAGSTLQKGLEVSIAESINMSENWFNKIAIGVSYAATNYTYDEYASDAKTLDGKYLPGVMRQTLASNLTLGFWNDKILITANNYWFDKAPLDNENLFWSKPYNLLNMRLDYRILRSPSENFAIGTYVGVNNLGNEDYSSFLQINAPVNRFYNPSPRRNFYFGFVMKIPMGFI